MRFEIMRLDEDGSSVTERQIVDAAGVQEIVEDAAAHGQRLYIRPVKVQALRSVA